MSAIAVSLTRDIHAAAPADAQSVSDAEFAYHLNRQLRSITTVDLADELIEASAEFAEAVKRNDPALLGRLMLAIRMAYAERLTARELCIDMRVQSAVEAARVVLGAKA